MNRVLISIGPITIYWYSVILLIAISSAIYLAIRESKKEGMSSFIEDLIISTVISGIIGARIYYVIFNFPEYKYNLLSIFKIWEGGIAIYGGIIGGLLAIIYKCKKKHKSLLKTTDIIVPGLILAQAIGRWGNFFNGEAHGGEVTLKFLKSLHLPNFIIEGMYINGSYYHPTFLYESLWCLLGFIILLIIRKYIKKKDGLLTYTYLIWYGIGRIIIEGLRTDSLYIGSMRVSQLVSGIIIIIGIVGLIINCLKKKKK